MSAIVTNSTSRRTFVLVHEQAKAGAKRAIDDPAYAGWRVRFMPPSKSRDQEEKYHAMIGDIAAQYEHCGHKWGAEDMKRILIDQFKRDTINDPEFADEWRQMGIVEMAPSLDGTGVVMLGAQSRKFTKKLASGFVEWLYALGGELNIKWSDPVVGMA